MKNTVIAALTAIYGFTSRPNGSLFWGYGSLASGETITITVCGERASIKHHAWFWDGADVEWERTTTVECYLAQVWEHLPSKVYEWAIPSRKARV